MRLAGYKPPNDVRKRLFPSNAATVLLGLRPTWMAPPHLRESRSDSETPSPASVALRLTRRACLTGIVFNFFAASHRVGAALAGSPGSLALAGRRRTFKLEHFTPTGTPQSSQLYDHRSHWQAQLGKFLTGTVPVLSGPARTKSPAGFLPLPIPA
jgi:hypothetical protein